MGGHVAWIVPEYRNGRPLWRMARMAVAHLVKARQVHVNESERLITFPSGGFLGLYSMDNPASILGEAFHLVVLDEAARIAEGVWSETIQPTLADVDGDALLITTPRGHNWVWREAIAAKGDKSGRMRFWQAPSSANPNPNIQRAALLARERVSDRTYRQEWLAEFVEDGGGVFRKAKEAARAKRQDRPIEGHRYAIGVDWAKTSDFTVFAVWDITIKALIYLDRMNMIDYTVQMGRLDALVQLFHPFIIIPELNSMGGPLAELLLGRGLPVRPFTTTNASKGMAVDALALAFERGEATIIDDPVLVGELQAYESERLPSGLLRYSAPEGMHDDCVMAAVMGWQAVTQQLSGQLLY